MKPPFRFGKLLTDLAPSLLRSVRVFSAVLGLFSMAAVTQAAVVATPTFNPVAGTYTSVQSVAIATTTSGASIRYTTNGTTPSSTVGTLYSTGTPVSIGATTTLKAIAYKSGWTNSSVRTGAYTINLPDTTFPTVSLTAPAASSTVAGITAVTATASDNVGVAGVQFLLDGANLGTEDTSSPYSFSWDANAVGVGAHTLTARARDAAGNQTVSAAISVTVTRAPAPANQVAALGFNEGSGTFVADDSGLGHTGTLVSSPTWSAGKYGSGLTFDGISNFVSLANSDTLNFGTSDFTVTTWVKRGAAPGAEDALFFKNNSNGTSTGSKEFWIRGDNSTLEFYCANNLAELRSTGTVANDGLWHHVAVTFADASNTMTFYIDGAAQGSGIVLTTRS